MLVVKLGEGAVADEELLDNDAAVGYDREGRVVHVKVLDASKKGLISAFAEPAKARAVERPPPAKVNKTHKLPKRARGQRASPGEGRALPADGKAEDSDPPRSYPLQS